MCLEKGTNQCWALKKIMRSIMHFMLCFWTTCDSEGNIVLPFSYLNTTYNQYCILPWQKADFLSVKFVSLGQWCVWNGLNLKCDVLQRELIDIFVYWKVLHEQQNTGRVRTLHRKMQLCYFSILYAVPLWSLSDVIKPEDIKQTRIFFDSTLKNLDKADFFSPLG